MSTRLDNLVRGDIRTITVSGLLDAAGDPAILNSSDILRFTMKRSEYDPDSRALMVKTSSVSPGGISFVAGTDTATITINPADWPVEYGDIDYVWDLQIAIGGVTTNVRTLASGTGRIVGDVTITSP